MKWNVEFFMFFWQSITQQKKIRTSFAKQFFLNIWLLKIMEVVRTKYKKKVENKILKYYFEPINRGRIFYIFLITYQNMNMFGFIVL